MTSAVRDDSPPIWHEVPNARELTGEGPHAISAGGVDLVLLRTGLERRPRVYEGRCPHQGALLGEGEIEGSELVCRNHRWRFDVTTGQRSGGPQCLRACPVREENGELRVDTGSLARASVKQAGTLRRIQDLPGPRGLPLVGSLFDFDVTRLQSVFETWAAEYGPMFVVKVMGRPVVITSDPKLAEPMYRARPDTFRRWSSLEPVFAEMQTSGVFSAEGDAWRSQRRLAMEALSQRHLRGFTPTLIAVAERLRKRWNLAAESGRELDMAEELKRFTVDVTTQLVFGRDLNTLEKGDEDVIQRHLGLIFPAFDRRLNSPFPYWRYVRLPGDRAVDKALAAVRAWLETVVAATRKELTEDPARAAKPANFIEAMLTAKDENGEAFTDEVIFGNALTMLLAGEDTTAYTLAWAVHHLCDAPAAMATLRREIDSVLGARHVPADLDEVNRLHFATAVANEAMRLRPVAPHNFFEPTCDVVVGDVAIPKGTGIISLSRFPALQGHHFDDPQSFDPGRWMDPGARKAHEAAVHVPFGSGPRICPGRTLALVEMRLVLATLYKSFDVIRIGRTEDVTEVMAFTMTPKGLRVRLHKRASVPTGVGAPTG